MAKLNFWQKLKRVKESSRSKITNGLIRYNNNRASKFRQLE